MGEAAGGGVVVAGAEFDGAVGVGVAAAVAPRVGRCGEGATGGGGGVAVGVVGVGGFCGGVL